MDEIVAFLSRMLDADDAVIARNRGNSGLGENGTYPDYQTYGGPDLEAASDYLDQFAPPRMAADVAEEMLGAYANCGLPLAPTVPHAGLMLNTYSPVHS